MTYQQAQEIVLSLYFLVGFVAYWTAFGTVAIFLFYSIRRER